MSSFRTNFVLAISAVVLVSPVYASHIHRSPTAGRTSSAQKTSATHSTTPTTAKPTSAHGKRTVRRARGQQAIEPERVTQIQQALIREHYLTSEANGKWDATTVAAMQKYQADHGWQTKLMPDSRALKNLGLGPDYSNAINAQGSNFAAPPAARNTPTTQTAGFTAASGVNQ